MIYTGYHYQKAAGKRQKIRADVCVIGSGAGGAAAAWRLANRGLRVALVEAGDLLTPRLMSQREEEMLPKLYYSAGGLKNTDRNLRVLHGKGLGGSTLHNINLCKRTPEEVFQEWGLSDWQRGLVDPLYRLVEEKLGVVSIESTQMNRLNQLFQKGTLALGYQGGLLAHNREGCVGSGFCELGCAFNAKKNAFRVLVPEILEKGSSIYCNARVARLNWSQDRKGRYRVTSALAEGRADGAPLDSKVLTEFEVEAEEFVLAGGAIQTPLLLKRSEIPDPQLHFGSRLHLHPGCVAAGLFDEPVQSWTGIPQSWECTEFLDFEKKGDHRVWLVGGAAHPAGMASLLPGDGAEHRELMKKAPGFAPISVMLHDQSRGRVEIDRLGGTRVDYRLNADDLRLMAFGLVEAGRILFAAGAREVLIPSDPLLRVRTVNELELAREKISQALISGRLEMVSVHPMSSVWMATEERDGPVNPQGRLHRAMNLRIADTSLYPTSLGVPPQITTYMTGVRIADFIAG